jgi:guanylate kinase
VSSRPADAAPPRLVVLSGPSGVGKSTVVDWLRGQDPDVFVSVSATTRRQRPGEVDGVNYRFLSDAEFDTLVSDGGLLEWAEFAGNRYGTPGAPVAKHLAAGRPVLLEIELQGARQVREVRPDALLVFLAPPSWDVLQQRLTGRGTEAPEALQRRLDAAVVELDAAAEFDAVIVNDDVEAVGTALLDFLHPSA